MKFNFGYSVENLEKFLADVMEGKIEPHLKSEPIPDNSGPLKTAVAKNFDEVVINNDKDTLVEFYAPWCGHCKKLTPVFEEVAQAMEGEDVAIVKMDATANDVPSNFEVRGFPTLYWLPKDSKDTHVRYEVSRLLLLSEPSCFTNSAQFLFRVVVIRRTSSNISPSVPQKN